MARYSLDKLRSQVLSNDVSAKWEREAGLLKPPLAHVREQVQAAVLEGQLSFVNEQAGVDIAALHDILDLVERGGHRHEIRLPEPEGEIRGRQRAGNGDAGAGERLTRAGLACDEAWAISVAHGGPVRQQCVAVGEVRVRVDGDRGDLELSTQCAAVERLDVLKLVLVRDSVGVDLPGGQRVEHERVVRVGRMSDANDATRGVHRGTSTRATARAASMSARCRVYSSRFRRRSAGSAAMRRRSNAVAADSLPASRAARIASTRPSKWFGSARKIVSAWARARSARPATSAMRPCRSAHRDRGA